jgi:hypothetical protein
MGTASIGPQDVRFQITITYVKKVDIGILWSFCKKAVENRGSNNDNVTDNHASLLPNG